LDEITFEKLVIEGKAYMSRLQKMGRRTRTVLRLKDRVGR
jgi:hypothetical protein